MRFAKCICLSCDSGEFMITFKNDIPKHSLKCPICGCDDKELIKITWIDRAEIGKKLGLV